MVSSNPPVNYTELTKKIDRLIKEDKNLPELLKDIVPEFNHQRS